MYRMLRKNLVPLLWSVTQSKTNRNVRFVRRKPNEFPVVEAKKIKGPSYQIHPYNYQDSSEDIDTPTVDVPLITQ